MSNVENKSQKAYRIDKDLAQGRKLIEEGKKIDTALKLINKSARVGETKGKSYFEVANIIRLGLPGLDANPEESRTYYDAARENFSAEENKDGMDYRERGDYHYYGLGTHPADINQALEYYDLGAKDGDEASAKKAEEIRLLLKKGNSDQAPHFDENAQVVKDRETKPEEETAPAKEEKTEERQARKASAPIYFVKPKQACPIRSEGQPIKTEDKDINDVIDKEQKLRQALRILDSAASSRQDKLDAIALAKEASEEGSCRASVLLGYLYEGDNELIGKDFDKAKEFYEKAIGQGSVSALFRLGILYTDQDTSFYNPDKGHERIIESARKGYSWSLCYLGDCFREKVRDPRNLEVAYRYYALAGERGLGLGYHNRAEIDASRQQFELASQHEKSAFEHGYDPAKGYQDPVFYTLHL
mgnify:FL=1